MHSFVEKTDSIYNKIIKKVNKNDTKSKIIDKFYVYFNEYITNFEKEIKKEYQDENVLLEMLAKFNDLAQNEIIFFSDLIYNEIKKNKEKNEINFPKILNEKSIFLKYPRIKGRIDRILDLNNEAIIIDFKSKKSYLYDSQKIQLWLYSYIAEAYLKRKINKAYIVSLEDYSFHRVNYDYKANKYINSLILEVYNSLKDKKLCSRSKNVNKCKNCSLRKACMQFD